MFIMLPIFGIIFIIIGVKAFQNPSSLLPKIYKESGNKKEAFKIHYSPWLIKMISIGFIIIGIHFTLSSLSFIF